MKTNKLRKNVSNVVRLSIALPLQILDSVRDSVQRLLFTDDPGSEPQSLSSTSAPIPSPAWLRQRRAASSQVDSRLLELPIEIRRQMHGYTVIRDCGIEIH